MRDSILFDSLFRSHLLLFTSDQIKSIDAPRKITNEEEEEERSKTITNRDPKLASASFILVDKYKLDQNTVDNPVLNCQNEMKTENSSDCPTDRIDCVSTCRSVSPVDDKHPEMTGPSGSLSLEATKPTKNQITSVNQKGKVTPIITRSRRVLAENIPYSGQILRSGKKRGINPPANDTSSAARKELEPNSELPSPVSEEIDVVGVKKEENVPLMDIMVSESKAAIADVNQDNDVDKKAAESPNKLAVPPTKRICRRKCSEPLKSERVQTRRSITVTQDRNNFKYFPQHSRTRRDSAKFKAGEKKSEKECTPDLTVNERNSNEKKGSIDKDKENNGGVLRALNLTNQKNLTQLKTPPDLKSAAEKKNDSKAKGKDSRSRKRSQENAAEDRKRKGGHINAQATPVYVNKTTAKKVIGLDSGVEVLLSSETGEDEVDERSATPRTEAETFFNSISLKSITNTSTVQKNRNSDSEETLSNVESVPNSPAQQLLQNVAGKRVKPSNRINSGVKNSAKKLVTHRIPAIEKLNTELQRPITTKQPRADFSSPRTDNSKPRFYVEASERENSPDSNASREIEDEALPWLRHPERPSSKTKNRIRLEDQTKESSSPNVENSASDNLPIPSRKRGRPRKEDTQGTETNPQKKKKPSASKRTDTAANGSRLTLTELDQLFSKYFQDGHFRVDPRQRPIVIYSNDLHQTFSSKIECYNAGRYLQHPSNAQARTNPDARTPVSSNYGGNAVCPSSVSPPALFEHRMRTTNPNSQNFSNQSTDQTRYSGDYVPHNNLNNYANMSPVSSYSQSGYGIAPSYQQNCYQNNGNSMGNNSCFNGFSDVVNATNSMNTSNENEFNYGQNSIPYKEIDLSMNNGMNLSTNNSMQNNITNDDWNEMNSVQEFWTNLNSMNNTNANQTVGNPDSIPPNLSYDQNIPPINNGQNPWMNRPNGTTNPRYPMMQPWLGSFPMYNSYLNNDSQYYNMFNPYSACMGFDAYSNNANARNGNEDPWIQNYHANAGFGNSNFNGMFPPFSGSPQDNNNMNQGMNLSLSNNRVRDQQNNSMELDDSVERESGPNSSLEQTGGNVSRVEPINVESVQQRYSLENTNNTPDNPDFNGVNMSREENQPQIQDYISKRLASFERCFQRCDSDETSNSGIVTDRANNREAEMSKLRQELVDFTRQYSTEQSLSLTSQILQEYESEQETFSVP